MENVVAIHLLRKNQLEGVYYLRGEDYEVDFFDEKEGELIQVSFVSSKDEINRNEIKSLVKGSDSLGINKLKLISWDLEDEINVNGKKIKVTPLWRFLLSP
jgi:predicted AAA+ superfamily ATPase